MVIFEDWIDYCPGGFERVFTREERSVTGHGVAQKPFVGRFFSRLFFGQVKLSLLADELFSWKLYASSERNCGVRGQPETQMVGTARRRG